MHVLHTVLILNLDQPLPRFLISHKIPVFLWLVRQGLVEPLQPLHQENLLVPSAPLDDPPVRPLELLHRVIKKSIDGLGGYLLRGVIQLFLFELVLDVLEDIGAPRDYLVARSGDLVDEASGPTLLKVLVDQPIEVQNSFVKIPLLILVLEGGDLFSEGGLHYEIRILHH